MVSTRSGGKSSSTMRKRGGSKKQASKATKPLVDTRDEMRKQLEEAIPSESLVWTFKLRCRYWLGFVLGAIACMGTYVTYQQDDDWKALKFVLWLFVSLLGLYFNETRPGKKYWYDQNGRIMHV